jgi:hypothetical protein
MRERARRAFVAAAIVAFTVATPVSSRAQSVAQLEDDAPRGTARVTPAWAASTAVQDVTPPKEQRKAVVIVVPAADQTQELRLLDGSRLYGRVVAIEADHILFRTTAGAEIQVPRGEILSLAVAEGHVVRGEFLPADPNTTRLFFGPTGRSLQQGEAYLSVYELLMSSVQVGVTDRFSIGGGTLLFFGFEEGRPAWITPKVQLYANDRAAVAAGVIHVFIPGEHDLGIPFVATTFGPSDAAVTIGTGCAYSTGNQGGCSALLMVGGERRLSRRVKFISENYVLKGNGLLSGGLRLLGDRLSAELGVVVPITTPQFAFPIANFVWRF